MKQFTKAIALMLSLALILCFPVGAFAAEPENATIDTAVKGSLTIYKVDLTNAEKDGVWDSSYVSTGVYDQTVNDTLNGYALKDVEFTYLRVADVVQFTEPTADGADFDHVETLYGINKTAGADLLSALGLANGANRYEKADSSDKLSASNYYYQSDVLISALKSALEANATTVKNALEAYVTAGGGTAMSLTDTYGKTKAENLELGLYLVVETKVPEMVTSTCNPFFISLPMTSGDGNGWIYDVTVYPKNLTGDPTLDKTLRESKDDTGKHNGTSGITDGYAVTGTASDGDTVDYQIISTLPSITSASTYLTAYTFVDTLSKGITYNKNDVVLEFFSDTACTDKIVTWREGEGKFTVTYSTADAGESKMTIEMTAEGLKEINTSKAVYAESSMVNSGYSDCTLRITYAATVSSSADVVYGDNGNPNEVVLTWKRTSQDSYDTLKDSAKVYTYGLELTKLFSDGKGDFSKVQFVMQNKTDGYYLKLNVGGSGIMGYIEIPKINVDLPIYHGTGSDSLDRGTGHLLGSSLPVGGESTHTIITGHSGMASQKMFTDLDQLREGDVFYLRVLDEVLAYQVDAVHTVLPHDTSFLGVVPGEDLCTLVTCTPTGINTHRLLVQGSRIPYEPTIEAQNAESEYEVAASSHWEDQYWLGIRLGLAAMVCIVLLLNVLLYLRKKKPKKGGRYVRK